MGYLSRRDLMGAAVAAAVLPRLPQPAAAGQADKVLTRYIAAYDTESPACLPACRNIVAVHKRLQMPATFFITGTTLHANAKEYKDLFSDPLFEVASHTWSHKLLRDHPLCGRAVSPDEQKQEIEQTLPKDTLSAYRGAYLETAQRLREQQGKSGAAPSPAVENLDFEFVLFASATIDYDYIMNLIARFTGQDPKKIKMTREQLIGLIESDAKLIDERATITDYVRSLEAGKALDEKAVREGYQRFKAEREAAELAEVAGKHGLTVDALQGFVDGILDRMIFDGEQLTDLMAPLGLSWRRRREKELALMDDLVPLLKNRAIGREISGLNAYEQ